MPHQSVSTARPGRFAAAAAAVVLILAALFASLSRSYPYFYIADMDHIITVDTLLVQSGLFPAHIHHPTYGVYLLLKLTHTIATRFGGLALGNLTDVSHALNPMFGVAELTDFVRAHSPALALATVAALAGAAAAGAAAFGSALLWSALALLAGLGLQSSVLYQVTMVRSELYAVFFWSLSLLAITPAARSRSWPWLSVGLTAGGFFVALALLSKVQALLHIAAVPIVYGLARELGSSRRPDDRAPTRPPTPVINGAMILGTLLFAPILTSALITAPPADLVTFTTDYGLNALGALAIAAYAALALAGICAARPGRTAVSRLARELWPLHFFALGFALAFLTHLFVLTPLPMGLRYLAYDAMMLFGRHLPSVDTPAVHSAFRQNPFLYLAVAVTGCALALRLRGVARLAPLALLAILDSVAIFAARDYFRDMIWSEMLGGFLLAFFALALAASAGPRRAGDRVGACLRAAPVLAALGLLATGLAGLPHIRPRLDIHYTQYGWVPRASSHAVYEDSPQKLFDRAIDDAYGSNAAAVVAGLASALDYAWRRREASYVFPNQEVTLKDVGLPVTGFRAWVNDSDWRLAEVPASLRQGILVDNLRLPARDFLFHPERVRNFFQGETWDKLSPGNPERAVAVSPRPDLDVYLFSETSPTGPYFEPSGLRTTLVNRSGATLRLAATRVTNYVELRPDAGLGRAFFVLAPKPL